MLKNVELYASLQEDFAFFGERRELQNEGWPQHTPWAVAYAHQEGARADGACSRTPLAAVVASRRRRQRGQRRRYAVRRGGGRLLLLRPRGVAIVRLTFDTEFAEISILSFTEGMRRIFDPAREFGTLIERLVLGILWCQHSDHGRTVLRVGSKFDVGGEGVSSFAARLGISCLALPVLRRCWGSTSESKFHAAVEIQCRGQTPSRILNFMLDCVEPEFGPAASRSLLGSSSAGR